MLKKHIANQFHHIVNTLPELNINLGFQFVSNKAYFEKAVYDYFGYFLNDKEKLLEKEKQLEQQLQQQQQLLASSQFSNSTNDNLLHQSTGQDWFGGSVDLKNAINERSPQSSINQDWINEDAKFKSTHLNGNVLLPYDIDQHSPESLANNWIMNSGSLNANQMLLNNLDAVSKHFQQRPTSPIGSVINLHQHQSNINSRSVTPCAATNNNLDNYALAAFNNSSLTQNLDQLSKLVQPAINNTGALSIQSVSPPVSEASNLANQAFAGNGNLNPPVRNVHMSHMNVRIKFGSLGPAKEQFHSPHGFCLGVDEDIVVADTNNHRIQIYDKNGKFKSQFGVPGREEGALWYPRKVTVMRSTGKYVVCDRGNERSRMQIFAKNGLFIKKISIRFIDIVAGLAINSQGKIVAVDSVSPSVFIISESGDLYHWFDCSNHMREPSDIAVSGNEYFVCDFKVSFKCKKNKRFFKFNFFLKGTLRCCIQ